MTRPATIGELERIRPEWRPWLRVLDEIVGEMSHPRWDPFVPDSLPGGGDASPPLLARTTISIDAHAVGAVLQRLSRRASAIPGGMASLDDAIARVDALAVFHAALLQDRERISALAADCGADAEALQAVGALVPLPFLHACRRRWASSAHWQSACGSCPMCGSWPAFAEVRGIDRARYLRCGRCGGEWLAHVLRCPYCDERDHSTLVTLVPDNSGANAVVEACTRCRGYLKAFTRLQGCPPAAVLLEDLASVELDVSALEQGFRRPADPGSPLELTVMQANARERPPVGTHDGHGPIASRLSAR